MKNSVTKTFLVALSLLLTSFSSSAIDLVSKIPGNSFMVLTINGQKALTKMPLNEFEKLTFIDSICQNITGPSEKRKASELGIQLNAPSYFFIEITDSCSYFGYLMPLSDAAKFSSIVPKNKTITTDSYGNKSFSLYESTVAWNNEFAIVLGGSATDAYFNKHPEVYENYLPSENINYGYDIIIDTTISYEENMKRNQADTIAIDTAYNYNGNYTDNYYSDYEEKKQKRTKILSIWLRLKSTLVFNLHISGSIAKNETFLASKNEEAEVTCWVSSKKSFFNNLYYLTAITMNSPVFSDQNYFSAALKFNATNITLHSDSHMEPKIAESYKKIVDAKFNKKFLKYIPGDSILAYYSAVANTEAFLNELPSFMEPYLSLFPYTKNISKELMDLYSLMLDEKAIGELVKGDAFFSITNLSQKEVEYSTYEYDSAYEYKKIMKTKLETVPEFLCMYSTDNMEMTNKLLNLISKSGGLLKLDTHYETTNYGGSAFKMYIVVKDGIVFFCNAKEQLYTILNNRKINPLSKIHASNLGKHSSNLYVNIQAILTKIPESEYMYKKEMLQYAKFSAREMTMMQSKPKNNTIHSEIVFTMPEGKENSFKYALLVIDELFKANNKKYTELKNTDTEYEKKD